MANVAVVPHGGVPMIAPGIGSRVIPINRGVRRRVRAGWNDTHGMAGLAEFVTTPNGRLTVPWNPVGLGGAPITGGCGPYGLGCDCTGPQGLQGFTDSLPTFLQGDMDIMGMSVPKIAVYGLGAVILIGALSGGKKGR